MTRAATISQARSVLSERPRSRHTARKAVFMISMVSGSNDCSLTKDRIGMMLLHAPTGGSATGLSAPRRLGRNRGRSEKINIDQDDGTARFPTQWRLNCGDAAPQDATHLGEHDQLARQPVEEHANALGRWPYLVPRFACVKNTMHC